MLVRRLPGEWAPRAGGVRSGSVTGWVGLSALVAELSRAKNNHPCGTPTHRPGACGRGSDGEGAVAREGCLAADPFAFTHGCGEGTIGAAGPGAAAVGE